MFDSALPLCSPFIVHCCLLSRLILTNNTHSLTSTVGVHTQYERDLLIDMHTVHVHNVVCYCKEKHTCTSCTSISGTKCLDATYTCSSCLFSCKNNKRHITLYNTTSFNQCTFMSPSLSPAPPERDNCQPMAAFCLACSILLSYTVYIRVTYSNYAIVTYIHVHVHSQSMSQCIIITILLSDLLFSQLLFQSHL